MSQNPSSAGRSRAKSASRAKGSRSSYSSSASERGRNSGHNTGHNNGNHKKNNDGFVRIAAGGVILIVAVALIAGIVKNMGQTSESKTEAEETTVEAIVETTAIQTTVEVEGVDITGMSRSEAEEALAERFPWSMTVVYEDDTYEVSNLISGRIASLLDEIYSTIPDESYELDLSGMESAAAEEAAAAASKWNKSAKNGSISGYDADSDKFLFTGAQSGISIDQEKLAKDILSAVSVKDFDAEITASADTVEPEISEASAREKYKTVASFTTNTTANSKRNTNIRLAAKAVNGTIVQPGETFSFNGTVGQRTEEKGYQEAGAYSNGEVVQEIGGGVCQVSSTLYNAVVKAGLTAVSRQSHAFVPSFVTPGTDATVSWGGPDYKFMNNSSTAIGIRASYSNQTCTVSIYAIPILGDGVTQSLSAEKTKDYTTGTEAERASGLQSKWEVRLVVKKDGEVTSRDVLYTTTYKSHTTENDAAAAASTEASTEAESTIEEIEESDGSEESQDSSGETESDSSQESTSAVISGPPSASGTGTSEVQQGPGSSTTIAPTQTSAAETTASSQNAPTAAAETTAEETTSSVPVVETIAPMPGG